MISVTTTAILDKQCNEQSGVNINLRSFLDSVIYYKRVLHLFIGLPNIKWNEISFAKFCPIRTIVKILFFAAFFWRRQKLLRFLRVYSQKVMEGMAGCQKQRQRTKIHTRTKRLATTWQKTKTIQHTCRCEKMCSSLTSTCTSR